MSLSQTTSTGEISRQGRAVVSGITAIVPAYNEAANIAATIRSLQQQTRTLDEIFVVDDCSTDGTGEIARRLGVKVLRPPQNRGSKAGAQTYALQFVGTEYCMAIDADTALARDSVEMTSHCNVRPLDSGGVRLCRTSVRSHDLGTRSLYRIPLCLHILQTDPRTFSKSR